MSITLQKWIAISILMLSAHMMLPGCSGSKKEVECDEPLFVSSPGGELSEPIELKLEYLALPGRVPSWIEPQNREKVREGLGPKIESLIPLNEFLWTIEPEDCNTTDPFLLLPEDTYRFVFKFMGKVYMKDQLWLSETDTFYTKRIKYSSVEWLSNQDLQHENTSDAER